MPSAQTVQPCGIVTRQELLTSNTKRALITNPVARERSETIETVITDEKNGDIDLGQRIGARRGGIEAVHGKEIENEIEMEGDTGTVVTEEMTETGRTESEVQAEKDTDHGEVYESSAHHSYLFTSTLNANLSSSRRPLVETSSFSLSLTKPL